MNVIHLSAGDVLTMKKKHPCGGAEFKVLRAGSDVRVVCTKCGRDMVLDRLKLEKSIKHIDNVTPNG